jgi:hypothetical protein
VKRIWQKEDDMICLRWTVHGYPRLPWDQEGTFDGVSTYKLDAHGKVCVLIPLCMPGSVSDEGYSNFLQNQHMFDRASQSGHLALSDIWPSPMAATLTCFYRRPTPASCFSRLH